MNNKKPYSLAEELANAISHGIGALLSVAGLTLLVVMSAIEENALKITSFAIYGTSLVMLFMASTLYHAISVPKVKAILKLVDHCAIYLLIAGTYTPLMLITLNGTLGYCLLILIWLLALLGIAFKLTFGHRYKITSLITYLGMGFISLFVIKQLYQSLPLTGLILLASGGLLYSLGIIFYIQKKIPFNHAIWHVFVLAAAGCHFTMMLYI